VQSIRIGRRGQSTKLVVRDEADSAVEMAVRCAFGSEAFRLLLIPFGTECGICHKVYPLSRASRASVMRVMRSRSFSARSIDPT
jgi:hypothetical protein